MFVPTPLTRNSDSKIAVRASVLRACKALFICALSMVTVSVWAQSTSPTLTSTTSFVPKVLEREEFTAKFGLSPIEYAKINAVVNGLNAQFIERKGLHAVINAHDGKKLQMTIPGLELTDVELTTLLGEYLSNAVGKEKSLEILRDVDARTTIEEQLGLELLRRNATYAFTRVQEENDIEHNLSMGYARFTVTYTLSNEPDRFGRQLTFPVQEVTGFAFNDSETVLRMGWNAMAKAPQGYFRSEPILGVASKPKGLPAVLEHLDSDKVDVLNNRFPGSIDTIEVPKG